MGYYKNEKATKETIDNDGFIHSGDEGLINEKGFVYITGRYKELIITAGGENIPPVLIEDSVKEKCKIISNAFLVGDGRKHLSILITFKTLPKPEGSFSHDLTPEVVSFVQTLNINVTTVDDLIKNPIICQFIEEVLTKVNKESTSRAQEIKKFRFIADDFSVPGGELTPTMKIKRKFVLEKYASMIEDIYHEPKL
jgi:long-chain-fatty-acid--CoA ligase ACSBG